MRVRFSLSALVAAFALLCTTRPVKAQDGPFIPVARLALGPAFHTAPEDETQTELAFDLTAGVGFFLEEWDDAGFVFLPELGYSYDGIGYHAFNLTAGVGFGHPLAFVAYQPRLILGGAEGGVAAGMRNGLGMHVLADIASLEVAHQFVHYGGEAHHDIRLMFGVNPAAFVFVASQL